MTKYRAMEVIKKHMRIVETMEKREEAARSRKVTASGKVYIIRKGDR